MLSLPDYDEVTCVSPKSKSVDEVYKVCVYNHQRTVTIREEKGKILERELQEGTKALVISPRRLFY